jgi:hypothetical protein
MIDVVHLVFLMANGGTKRNVIFWFKGHSHFIASSWIMFQSEQFWTDVFWNWHSKDVWLMYRSFHFWMTLLSVMQLWFAVNGGWQVYMRTFRSRSTLKVEKSVTIKLHYYVCDTQKQHNSIWMEPLVWMRVWFNRQCGLSGTWRCW